jgi:APA family basic amino acid/polyamine antiporter
MTLALVVGGVVGSGIFYLPVALAPLGASVPIGWLISGIGVMALAYCASRIVSADGGGLQAYIEHELGPTAGFLVTWITWNSSWIGNPAVALATAAALGRILPGVADHLVILSFMFMLIVTGVNMGGIKAAGELNFVTVLIKILPLLAVVVIATALGFGGRSLQRIDVPAASFANIATASALCLWALTGFEFSLAPVGKIRDPERNLSRALVLGLATIAICYLLATLALSLIIPNATIAKSIAPFSDAIGVYLGEGAAVLAAVAMAVSAFGTLNVALLGTGEMLFSMGLRGDMPRYFARTNRFNAPYAAQLTSAALGCVLLGLNAAKETAQLFTFMTLLAADAVVYLYSAAAIAAMIKDRRPVTTLAGLIGLSFVLFAFYGSGLEAFLLSLGLVVLGGAIFLIRKAWTSPRAEVVASAPRV